MNMTLIQLSILNPRHVVLIIILQIYTFTHGATVCNGESVTYNLSSLFKFIEAKNGAWTARYHMPIWLHTNYHNTLSPLTLNSMTYPVPSYLPTYQNEKRKEKEKGDSLPLISSLFSF
uniref:Uncharacterized protein n=1 Tax=Cacopsylla melanoneura TaxID=428564 RepID=A0A8D8R967_9HEMI